MRSDNGKQVQRYNREVIHQQLKIRELETRLGVLQAELVQQQGLKSQVKNLYRSLDNRIMRSIDNRGFKPPVTKQLEKTLEFDKRQSPAGLSKIARRYDVERYFRYSAPRTGMKLRWRIVAKAYRTTRDMTKTGAKKGYRIMKGAR